VIAVFAEDWTHKRHPLHHVQLGLTTVLSWHAPATQWHSQLLLTAVCLPTGHTDIRTMYLFYQVAVIAWHAWHVL
jgi:hypothetical protein